MFLKLKRAADTDMWEIKPTLQFATQVRHARQGFAMEFLEFRLVLKRIHLTDTPLHEQEDTVLCTARMMLRLNGLRITGIGCQLIRHHSPKGECADTVERLIQELSTRYCVHHVQST